MLKIVLFVLAFFTLGMNWIFIQAPVASFTNAQSFGPDGTDEEINRLDDNLLDATTALSFGCWVKGSSGINFAGIISHWIGSSRGYLLGLGGTGENTKPRFQFCGTGVGESATCGLEKTGVADSAVIIDGNWHHLGVTFSSGTVALYVDGASVAFTYDVNESFTSLYPSTANVTIGNYDGSSFWFIGNIDECFIDAANAYSAGTMANIYNSGTPTHLIDDEGLSPTAYWRFESDSNATTSFGILDETANAFHATGSNLEAADLEADVP